MLDFLKIYHVSTLQRYLAKAFDRANNIKSFRRTIKRFSLVGITIGVGTLIVVMSIMNGFRQELMRSILGVNGHFDIYSRASNYFDESDSILERIKKVDGVKSAYFLLEKQAIVTNQNETIGIRSYGIAGNDLEKKTVINSKLTKGALNDFHGKSIIIGKRLADKMRVGIGESIKILSPHFTQSAFGSIPRSANFKVVGIFEIGMYEYDLSVVYMPKDFAKKFFLSSGKVTQIEVNINDAEQTDSIKKKLNDAVARYGFKVLSWKDVNSRFFSSLDTERIAMFIILSMIIIVAVFNVTTLLYMLVQDKRSEIAILKSFGARSRDILRAFIFTGLRLSLKGTFLGCVLGFLFLFNMERIKYFLQYIFNVKIFDASVYFLNKIPYKIGNEVFYIVGLAIVLSIIASIMPALKAASENPAEVLSNE